MRRWWSGGALRPSICYFCSVYDVIYFVDREWWHNIYIFSSLSYETMLHPNCIATLFVTCSPPSQPSPSPVRPCPVCPPWHRTCPRTPWCRIEYLAQKKIVMDKKSIIFGNVLTNYFSFGLKGVSLRFEPDIGVPGVGVAGLLSAPPLPGGPVLRPDLGPELLHVQDPGVPRPAPPLLLLCHGVDVVRVSLPVIILPVTNTLPPSPGNFGLCGWHLINNPTFNLV